MSLLAFPGTLLSCREESDLDLIEMDWTHQMNIFTCSWFNTMRSVFVLNYFDMSIMFRLLTGFVHCFCRLEDILFMQSLICLDEFWHAWIWVAPFHFEQTMIKNIVFQKIQHKVLAWEIPSWMRGFCNMILSQLLPINCHTKMYKNR